MIPAILHSMEDVAQGVRNIHLKLKEPLNYKAGQYVMLAFEDALEQKRAFSILNTQGDLLTLGIQEHKDFTKRLFSSTAGERIAVFGPYGRFTLRSPHKNNIFIAGGIGITPLLSMLRELPEHANAHLFYCAKSPSHMAYLKEVRALPFDVRLYFTRVESSLGKHSHITLEDIKTIPHWSSSDYYICGPNALIDTFRSDLIAAGVKEDHIYSEDFR
ncbi:hypothetical protein D6774_02900 [Candidatus Woesearchaeota archaeon]|nr:MAG: hypothetical protein D6774_02900 [Candidatus Woesearchaeota archaeon]